jgi:UDP-2,3-diacylglucosamine pyrophosphatase LpxH
MAVAVIADAHLGGPGGSAAPLVAQLEALPGQGAERLLLLGDLFQGWVGFERFETPDVAAVVAALRRLRAGGMRVDYVEGNRDFFLADSIYADAFDAVVDEVAFTAGGVRYLAVHGDGLDPRDWQYRFWRRAAKSAVSRFVLSTTPRRLAHHLVSSTEERLSQTNQRHKRVLPEEAIRAHAERRLAEGHDVLLLGHFHEPRLWPVAGGEVRLLEAWFTSRRVEWLPPPAAERAG